jgi:acyl carrier protein
VETFVLERLQARSGGARAEKLGRDTNLIEAGILDSFALLELVSTVEERFGVQIDVGAYDFEVFSTLGGFCDAVVSSG